MQDVLQRPDVTLILDPFEAEEPACEGPTHPESKFGHQPGQPATFCVVFPCGLSVLMCAGWVRARDGDPGQLCLCVCSQYHPTDQLRFIPL